MLHHVELYVANLQHSLAFWAPFLFGLGYHESQRWSEGVSYMSGETYICFVQAPTEHIEAGYHRKRVGLNHLAFHAKSRRSGCTMSKVRKPGTGFGGIALGQNHRKTLEKDYPHSFDVDSLRMRESVRSSPERFDRDSHVQTSADDYQRVRIYH